MRNFVRVALVSWSLLCGVVLSLGAQLGAQSLADVARKEEARRKTVADPAKVYTNKDLKGQPPPSTTTSTTQAAPTDAKDADKSAGQTDKTAASKDGAKDKEPVKDKAYWASRLKALQDQLDHDQTFAEALQSRINGLTAQFVNRDDPAQRAVIERDRLKAVAELDKVKAAIPKDKQAIDDLLEEARRANVPPGWLR